VLPKTLETGVLLNAIAAAVSRDRRLCSSELH
jgi:hypothetical protein